MESESSASESELSKTDGNGDRRHIYVASAFDQVKSDQDHHMRKSEVNPGQLRGRGKSSRASTYFGRQNMTTEDIAKG